MASKWTVDGTDGNSMALLATGGKILVAAKAFREVHTKGMRPNTFVKGHGAVRLVVRCFRCVRAEIKIRAYVQSLERLRWHRLLISKGGKKLPIEDTRGADVTINLAYTPEQWLTNAGDAWHNLRNLSDKRFRIKLSISVLKDGKRRQKICFVSPTFLLETSRAPKTKSPDCTAPSPIMEEDDDGEISVLENEIARMQKIVEETEAKREYLEDVRERMMKEVEDARREIEHDREDLRRERERFEAEKQVVPELATLQKDHDNLGRMYAQADEERNEMRAMLQRMQTIFAGAKDDTHQLIQTHKRRREDMESDFARDLIEVEQKRWKESREEIDRQTKEDDVREDVETYGVSPIYLSESPFAVLGIPIDLDLFADGDLAEIVADSYKRTVKDAKRSFRSDQHGLTERLHLINTSKQWLANEVVPYILSERQYANEYGDTCVIEEAIELVLDAVYIE
jgi:hypothetical protein